MNREVWVWAAGTKRRNGEYSYRFYCGQKPTGYDTLTYTGCLYEVECNETGSITIGYWEQAGAYPQPSFKQLQRLENYAGLRVGQAKPA